MGGENHFSLIMFVDPIRNPGRFSRILKKPVHSEYRKAHGATLPIDIESVIFYSNTMVQRYSKNVLLLSPWNCRIV